MFEVKPLLVVSMLGRFVAFWATVSSQAPTGAVPSTPRPELGVAGPSGEYVGSASCRTCHEAIYERWSKTRMANVVVDPRQRPDAILPDLDRPDPLLTFRREEIALTYGSK